MRVPVQLTPSELLGNFALVRYRQDGIAALRTLPLFLWRDTPTRSLYRLYEYICAGMCDQVSAEVEYFFFQPCLSRWRLADIADPEDNNTQRYAILASTVETLVQAFNWRLSLGLRRDGRRVTRKEIESSPPPEERAPTWTRHVGRLDEHLDLCGTPNTKTHPFSQRNIAVNTGYFYSI